MSNEQTINNKDKRSIKESIFHALLFEFFAIIFTTLIGYYAMNKGVNEMWKLAVIISFIAISVNIVFNRIFNYIFPFKNGERPVKIRILHLFFFEFFLIIIIIPTISWFLKISLWEATKMQAVFLVFFFFYNYIYNYIYDTIRKKIVYR